MLLLSSALVLSSMLGTADNDWQVICRSGYPVKIDDGMVFTIDSWRMQSHRKRQVRSPMYIPDWAFPERDAGAKASTKDLLAVHNMRNSGWLAYAAAPGSLFNYLMKEPRAYLALDDEFKLAYKDLTKTGNKKCTVS